MTLLDRVRAATDPRCLVRRCRKAGCTVPLVDSPPHVVLDLDKPGSPAGANRARCDYLVFLHEARRASSTLVALELKRGRPSGGVVDQLQGGTDAADRLIPVSESVEFLPVVAHRGIHRRVRDELRRCVVRFRDAAEPVYLIECGEPLAIAVTRALSVRR